MTPMNEASEFRDLLPALPEIVLAVGAMVLLMLGAFRGERSAGAMQLARDPPAYWPRARSWSGCRRASSSPFGGSFVVDPFARFLKLLALTGSATAILMSTSYLKVERQERFEYPILIVLSTDRHADADLGGRPDRALSRPRAHESRALRASRRSTVTRVKSSEAGLKYFVLGALSSGMLLYGASLIYGFTGTVSFAGIAKAAGDGGIGLVFGLVFLFAGFCFKVSGGAVPYVDAGRLRGRAHADHGLLRRRAQGCRHRHFRAHHHRGVPGDRLAVAADRGVRRHRLDGARRVRGDRADATSSG